MPTAYLKKVSDERGIALKKLEEYWNKAKEIAKQHKDIQGEDYWKYVMGIFQNMASLNGVSVSSAYESISKRVSKLTKPARPKKPAKPPRNKPANKAKPKPSSKAKPKTKPKAKPKAPRKSTAVKLPEWWRKKTELGKKKYIEQHPGSKYSKQGAKGNPTLEKTLKAAQKKAGILPSSTLERDSKKVNDQIKSMKPPESKVGPAPKPVIKNPIPEPQVMPAGGHTKEQQTEKFEHEQKLEAKKHKTIFHRAYFKARQKINHTLKRDQLGRHCVGKFLTGHKLTDNEHKHMINWVGVAAKLVVGVAVGAALFTPLAGMAPELGENFLKMLSGNSESSGVNTSESKSDGVPSSTKGKIVPIGNPDKFEPTDFTDRLEEWLLKQDIPALVKKLQEEKEGK